MNIISRLLRNEARAALFGAENSSGFISRQSRFVSNKDLGYFALPINPFRKKSPFDGSCIIAGEITDVVIEALNHLSYMDLVEAVDGLGSSTMRRLGRDYGAIRKKR